MPFASSKRIIAAGVGFGLVVIVNAGLLYRDFRLLYEAQLPIQQTLHAGAALDDILIDTLQLNALLADNGRQTTNWSSLVRHTVLDLRRRMADVRLPKDLNESQRRSLEKLQGVVNTALRQSGVDNPDDIQAAHSLPIHNSLMSEISTLIGGIDFENVSALSKYQLAQSNAMADARVTFGMAVGINVILLMAMLGLVHFNQKAHARIKERLLERNDALSSSIEDISRNNVYIARLSEFSNFLQACVTLQELGKIVTHFAPRMFAVEAGGLYVCDDRTHSYDLLAQWGDAPLTPSFDAPQCWALRRGQAHFPQIHGDDWVDCDHADAGHQYACLPLTAGGHLVGLLHFIEPTMSDDAFPMRLIDTTAERLAAAIVNLKLRENLHQQSIRDPLTSLYNRRFLEEVLSREILRIERRHANDPHASLAVLMVDVDHFKRFNDRFGHDAGDAVLREVARVLRDRTRQTDVVCRYGGEEFTVVMPDADTKCALERAEVLRKSVQQLQLVHGGQVLPSVAVSVGVAIAPLHGRSQTSLMLAADTALYSAKEQGRNRVVLANHPGSMDDAGDAQAAPAAG